MTAWANLSAGRHSDAHAAVGPLLNGSVPVVLPHTVVEALLVEATAGVRRGEVQVARTALRTALSLAKPLDVLRRSPPPSRRPAHCWTVNSTNPQHRTRSPPAH